MHTLRFFGSARIDGAPGDPAERLSQPRALAILACLSTGGRDGWTRDKLVGLFWQDLDTGHARHALSVQLHQIRRALGKNTILTTGDLVRLNPETVGADVADFTDAIGAGHLRRAADLYQGPFLDGFHLSGCAGFERWTEDERQRLAVQYLEVLETLATRAESEGSPIGAVAWWQRAAQHDPYNSRVALACARALAATGDRGNGVQFLREHAERLRAELEIEPDDEILTAIRTGDFGVSPGYGNGRGHSAAPEAVKPPGESAPHAAVAGRPSSAAPDGGVQRAAPLEGGAGTTTRGPRRGWKQRAVVPTIVTVLVLASALAVRARNSESYTPGRIAVLPTVAVGIDSAIATLTTAHLHASLAEWRSFETTSQDVVAELWRSSGGTVRSAPSERATRTLAARLGAGLVLTSRVTPVAEGFELHAVLADAADGVSIATASVITPSDSLRVAAERLLIRLMARTSRVPDERIAILGAQDPEAVRLYLQSRRESLEERDRLLRDALDRDSTFALAALELLEDAVWSPGRLRESPWHSAAATAWTHRQRLSPADRAYAEALTGWLFAPRYTAAQHVQAWEHAVEMAPDEPRILRGLALACYRWCSELNAGWRGRWTDRALEVQDALLAAGDTGAWLLEVGVEVAFVAGDRDRVRRYADLLPDGARYGRWLVSIALGDEHESVQLRRLIREGEFFDHRVGNVAVLTGVGLEDAEIIANRDRNSGYIHQLRAQVQARERGRHAEYRMLRDKMFQLQHTTPMADVFLAHLAVWEWAYFDEPEADSVLERHERTLTDILDRRTSVAPDTLATAYCALAQLRLGRGDTTGVADAIAFLTHAPTARDLAASRICAPLLELLAARGKGNEAVTRAARRLNESVADRPLDLGNGAGMINVEIMLAGAANLELARTYLALGYPEAGLRAVVRRPYLAGLWGLFGFHIEFLLEEARLLAAAGVTDQALAKYDLYFRLRPKPPDLQSWRETWETARAERAALLPGNDR